jgi:hypothetical protein
MVTRPSGRSDYPDHHTNLYAVGVLLIGLGDPVMRGSVSRNSAYETRFPSTLGSDRIWQVDSTTPNLAPVLVGRSRVRANPL